MAISLYHCYTESIMRQYSLHDLLTQIPASFHERALRYKSEISVYNYVIGRLLIKKGMQDLNLDQDLEKIKLSANGKPFIPGVYFNISHSEYQVICSFSKDVEHGVDIEKITPVDFEDFDSMFTIKEWDVIKSSEDPLRSFYWFWTRKESIIKALGFTLGHLHQIELDVTLDYFVVEGKKWFLREVDFEEGYVVSVCSEEAVSKIEIVGTSEFFTPP